MKTIQKIIWGALLAGFGALALAAEPSNTPVAVDIARQPLRDALALFAKQTGLQVMLREESVEAEQQIARNVKGTLSPREALAQLLEQTNLQYEFVTDKMVRITPVTPGLEAAGRADAGDPGEKSSGRLAQNNGQNPSMQKLEGDAQQSGKTKEDSTASRRDVVQEIVVTGTNIRGHSAKISPVVVMDRNYIDSIGAATVRDVLATLPQNFGGGVNENTVVGPGGTVSTGYAATANLRGLGSAATMVLLDGRRIASAGISGAVDISTIPLSAIERVEVLTDGASAVYGSDAVAGVINFITRKNLQGLESAMQFGAATEGALQEMQLSQSAGTAWTDGRVMGTFEYYDRDPLLARDRDFLSRVPGGSFVTPDTLRRSFILNADQSLTEAAALYANVLFSDSNKEVYAVTAGRNDVYETSQITASGGLTYQLPRAWALDLNGQFGRSRQRTAVTSSTNITRRENEVYGVTAKADGALFELPAGAVSAAIGAEFRKEEFAQSPTILTGDRDVRATFVEASVPLVSGKSAPALSLSLAGRYEDYSDFGSSFVPKFGLQWRPFTALSLRGTWGKSFHAPLFTDLYSSQMTVVNRIPDPQAPTPPGTSIIMLASGGNPNLDPETGTTYTIGADFSPEFQPGLTISATYFRTKYDDQVGTPFTNVFTVLTVDEAALGPQIVQRNPSAAAVTQANNSATRQISAIGPWTPADIRVLLLAYTTNIASANVEGVDLSIAQKWATSFGELKFSLAGAYLLENTKQLTPALPEQQLLNSTFNPTDMKIRAGLSGQAGWFSSGLYLNYTSSYEDTTVTPRGRVGSYFTTDIQLAADLGARFHNAFTDGLSLAVSVRDLFDRGPPSVAGGTGFFQSAIYGYDPANADPIGQFVSISVRKRW